MVEVLIGLGVIVLVAWFFLGTAWAIFEEFDPLNWRLHLALLPLYFGLCILAYKIGSGVLGG